MGDSTEEFEPLFDYRRVQPVSFISLDDDSDSSPPISPKRRKTDKNNKEDENNKEGKPVVAIDVEEKEDEEDWLPPPPKMIVNSSKLEDSAIRELRLKKQELASLARSAEDALRSVEEAAKKALSTSSHDLSEDTEELPKPSSNRAKIVISIQDKSGTKQYRVFADETFEQLFRKYAEKAKIDLQNLAFCFDGDKISPASTPQELGMEDDDLIEVHVKAR